MMAAPMATASSGCTFWEGGFLNSRLEPRDQSRRLTPPLLHHGPIVLGPELGVLQEEANSQSQRFILVQQVLEGGKKFIRTINFWDDTIDLNSLIKFGTFNSNKYKKTIDEKIKFEKLKLEHDYNEL